MAIDKEKVGMAVEKLKALFSTRKFAVEAERMLVVHRVSRLLKILWENREYKKFNELYKFVEDDADDLCRDVMQPMIAQTLHKNETIDNSLGNRG